MADEGISTIKEGVASNRLLTAPQAAPLIGALEEQVRIAERAPGVLRRAGQEGRNQLRMIQAQRAASMRGSGVATGGGAGGGSGTAQMRQDLASAAQQLATEQSALEAEMRAGEVKSQALGEIGNIKAQQQAFVGNFVDDLVTTISQYGASGRRPDLTGNYVAGRLNTRDPSDPAQREAMIQGLGAWLSQRGWKATPAELAAIVDSGRAGEIADKAGKIAPTAGPTGKDIVGYLTE